MTAMTTRLRQRLGQPEILPAPGVADAFMAKLVERAGFEAVYMTGAGVSHSTLGMPDVGLLSFSEMLTRAGQIAEAVDIPLVADADTGYGNALNVQRTVKEYQKAGVAGMHIEDQTFPKRCGHFGGKTVIPTGEMVGKVKAALDARTDPDFVIIARTDARTARSMEEAVERAQAYAEAGADMIFVESPLSVEELQQAATCVDVPTMANMVEGGRTPLQTTAQLQELGFSFVIYPGMIMRTAAFAIAEVLSQLRQTGDASEFGDRAYDFTEINEIVGLPEVNERSERYAAYEPAPRT